MISLITFLILVILVLVIVVAVTNKNKDAKIAEVEVDNNMRRHGKKSTQKNYSISQLAGDYPKTVSVYSTGEASKVHKSSMGDYEIVPGLMVRSIS